MTTHQEELSAAYQRITELEGTLSEIRALYKAGESDDDAHDFDPFDLIEKTVEKIDKTLDPTVISAPPG